MSIFPSRAIGPNGLAASHTCGNTTHLDDDKLSGGIRAAASAAGFSPERPVIEIRGTCPDCKEG